jgi:dienelactone hydrolase
VGIVGLIMTYSRGGWLAFLAGMITYIIAMPTRRYYYYSIIAIFILLIFWMPAGLGRAASIVDSEDLSISNRLMVWRGAAAMTCEHWFSGVGGAAFGVEYNAWYQPTGSKSRYATAVNNLLTLSSERGILILGLYLVACLGPWFIAWHYAYDSKKYWIFGILASQVTYFVSGLFTYNLTIWPITILFCILYFINVHFIFTCWRRGERIPLSRWLIPTIVCSFILCSGIMLYGFYQTLQLPVLCQKISITGNPFFQEAVFAEPQTHRLHGLIIFYHDAGHSIESDGQDIIRPLAKNGFSVLAVDYRARGLLGLEDVQWFNNWASHQKAFKDMPIWVMGTGLGGRLAILAACKVTRGIRGVSSIGSESEWPFSQLSPLDHLATLSCPLLIMHGRYDEAVPVEQAYQLYNLCKHYGKHSELTIYASADHDLIDQPDVLTRTTSFFQNCK